MELKAKSLKELAEKIASCQDCQLSKTRTHTVPGDGPENATILFIGEAPGWHEDQQGRPFVGAAGQFLNELFSSIGIKREEVYITNVVKCRPPGNRDPLPKEIAACRKYLEKQIEIIQPKVIVTLGRYSLSLFFPGESISKVHGTWRRGNGYICMAMYHPAAALHQQRLREIIKKDFLKLPQVLKEAEGLKAENKPQQLSLF